MQFFHIVIMNIRILDMTLLVEPGQQNYVFNYWNISFNFYFIVLFLCCPVNWICKIMRKDISYASDYPKSEVNWIDKITRKDISYASNYPKSVEK